MTTKFLYDKFVKNNYVLWHNYKLAFYTIPKSGTSTIFYMMLQKERPRLTKTFSKENIFQLWDESIRYLDRTDKRNVPNNYRKIVFIRNPYSRVFSSFRYEKYHETFNTFIVHNLNKNSSGLMYLSFQQYLNHLTDDTEIFRFENFQIELEKILLSAGMKNVEIPHINKPYNDDNYIMCYSKFAKMVVSHYYQWDLTNLNYTFDSYGETPSITELKRNVQNV